MLVERDDERLFEAVAVEDQQVAEQDRGSTVAVLRVVAELRLPEHSAVGRERRGAVGAEVHVDAVAVDDRRRRRAAVLGVDDERIAPAAEHLRR